MKGKTIKYAMVFSVLLLVLVFTASAAALKTGSLNVNGASVEISLEDATTVSIKYPGAKGSEDILDYTGFDFNIYGKNGWMEKEDEKMND